MSANNVSRGISTWWQSLPLGSRAVFTVNAAVYVLGLCVPQNWSFSSAQAPGHFCMFPKVIWVSPGQSYRIVTSAFVHGGLMHIGFNMFNFAASGPNLERQIGSIKFLSLIMTFVLTLGALYFVIAVGAAFVFRYGRFFNECAVGFSGVLFALITTETLTVSADRVYNFWGNRIPARWYPWALLIFSQVIMPNVSFIGHLVGILGAYLYVWGVYDPVLLPNRLVEWLEDVSWLTSVVEHPAYVKSARTDPSLDQSRRWNVMSTLNRFTSALWAPRTPQQQDMDDLEAGHAVSQPRFRGLGTWGSGSRGAYAPVANEGVLPPDSQDRASDMDRQNNEREQPSGKQSPPVSDDELRAKAAAAAAGRLQKTLEKLEPKLRTSMAQPHPRISSSVPTASMETGHIPRPPTNWIPLQDRPEAAYSFGQGNADRSATQAVPGGQRELNQSFPATQEPTSIAGSHDAAGMSELLAMGFEEEESRQMLSICEGNVGEAAVQLSEARQERLGPLRSVIG